MGWRATRYITPLDEPAAKLFVAAFVHYVGEPTAAICLCLLCLAYAAILWCFGEYGTGLGIVATVATYAPIARMMHTQMCLANWKNPQMLAQKPPQA